MGDIQISELPETSLAANRHFIAIDDGTTTHKISVQNFNANGAASAAQSAAAAAQSASAALASQTAAEQAEDDAQALITSAQTIVSSAQTYANEASTSAGTASTAANTATAQAAIATSAATDAGTYARNVNSFAIEAESYAVGGTGTRYNEDTDNSKYYSQQAHTSEINAASSEAIAVEKAASAHTDAAAAIDSAVRASASEISASQDATNASASATSAASDAQRASTFALQANNSKETAEDCADTSQAWAWGKVDGVDVPSTHPAYHNNAKYWADAAAGGVSGVSSFNSRSGNVVPALGDYSADIVGFSNSSNGFTASDTQSAIEEVQDNVDTLDGSLATVAKSGSYADLSNKPTLGTAAAKNSTDTISSGSTDLATAGAVQNAINNGVYWNSINNKPFEAISAGLATKTIGQRTCLVADVVSVSVDWVSDNSGFDYQAVIIEDADGNITNYEIHGTKHKSEPVVLSTSQVTVQVFRNQDINPNSIVDVYTNRSDIKPSGVNVTYGEVDVLYPAQTNPSESVLTTVYFRNT